MPDAEDHEKRNLHDVDGNVLPVEGASTLGGDPGDKKKENETATRMKTGPVAVKGGWDRGSQLCSHEDAEVTATITPG